MTTYYVDSSSSLASDKNAGLSSTTPLASLDAVNRLNLQPGDVVAFKAGTTYASMASGTGALVIKASGTADKPITFTSYGEGAAPIIKNLASGYSDGILLTGAKNVTIDGLTVTGGAQAGINVDQTSSFIKIQNVEASGVGEGVLLAGSNSLVTHSSFHDLKMIKNTANVADDDYGAVGITVSGSNNEISFNKILNASASSYDYGKDGGGIELFGTISNVSIHDNWVENSVGFIEAGGLKSSISNITITNNVSLNNGTFLVLHNGGGQYAATLSNIDASRNTIVNQKGATSDMAVVFLDAAYKTGQLNFHDNAVYLEGGDSVFKQAGNYHSNNTFYLASSATHLYNNWTMTLSSGEAFGKLTGNSSGAALVASVASQSGRGAAVTADQTGIVPVVAKAVAPAVPIVTDTTGITGQSYVSEHKVVNVNGSVALLERFHADGTKDYAQVLGADGSTTALTYDAAGLLTTKTVTAVGGTSVTTSFDKKGAVVETLEKNAAGIQTATASYHADGTRDYVTNLNADGSTTALKYDDAGTLAVKNVTQANGASVMTWFDKKGAVTNTAEKNTAGIQIASLSYRADGTKDYATNLNADGSTTALKYDAAGMLATKTVTQGGGATATTFFDKQGHVTATIEKNAAGVQIGQVSYHTDGTKDYATSLGADGSTTALKYDAAGLLSVKVVTAASGSNVTSSFDKQGHVTSAIEKATNGSTTTLAYDATEALTAKTVTAASGSSMKTWFDKDGHVTATVEKNAAGVQIGQVSYHTDGTKDYATSLGTDGSTTALKYDAAGSLSVKTVTALGGSNVTTWFDKDGHITSMIEKSAAGVQTSQINYHTDGTKDSARLLNDDASTSVLKYDASGALSSQVVTQKDGSQDVYQFKIEGKSYGSTHHVYDASKQLQFGESFNNDGTHSTTVAATNVTIAATAAKDIFTAYGADTFVFGAGSGKDMIYNFHAGSSASHDTISLSKSVASDFAHLNMRQAGSDVVIDLGAQDSITLKSMSLSALTHHDFLFV